MKHLNYDMIGAYDSGVKIHPQQDMKNLGITYQHATPQSIADSWWFWCCENIPDNLPSYITEGNWNPLECVGWGLDEKTAEKLATYIALKEAQVT